MATGKVKWFDRKKGYGFIEPEEGGEDVFVHSTALEAAGILALDDGKKVEYELSERRGKTSAVEISLL